MKNIVFFLISNPCEEPEILKIIFFIRSILNVAFIAVPIVLIVLITFDFIKSVMAGSEDVMKKNQKIVIKRLVYAIMLFFVMPIVNLAFSAFGTSGNSELISENIDGKKVNYLSCWDNAKDKSTINSFEITVTFDGNGGNVYGDKERKCGGSSSCEVTAPNVSRNGYTFYGWTTKVATAVIKKYKVGEKIVATKSENSFYACWDENCTRGYVDNTIDENNNNSNNNTNNNNNSNNNSSNNSSNNTTTQDNSAETNNYIFVGDSRTCGMSSAVRMLYEESVICEVGESINWFNDTAIAKINSKLTNNSSKKYNIIINLGVNNPYNGNAEKYYSKYNELKNNDWKEHNVVIASVDPVDENKYKTISNYNTIIEKFNNDLKNNLNSNIKYCNTYDDVKELIKDSSNTDSAGLHYSNLVYQKIYTKLKECANN